MRLNPEYFEDSSDDDEPKVAKPFQFLEELPPEILKKVAVNKIALSQIIERQNEQGDKDPLLTIIALQSHQIRVAQKALLKMKDVLQVLVDKSDDLDDLDLPF